MTRTRKKLLIVFVCLLVLTAGVLIWYFIPITLPGGMTYSRVNEIMIFDSSSGRRIYVRGSEDIREITEGFQSVKMHRNGGLFSSDDGVSFTIDFNNSAGNIESLTVYDKNSVRGTVFDYKTDEPIPCYGRITEMIGRVRDERPEERDIEARLDA